MKVIPSIDIVDNQVVRLEKGDYNKMKIYSDSILNTAQEYEKNGFDLIHIVDLIGSREGKLFVENEIKELKNKTSLNIQFGGGVRSIKNAELLFNLGIEKIVIGSMSINKKEEFEQIVNKFGSEKIIIAADVKDENIAIKGWTETSTITIDDHIEYCKSLGLNEYLITDISKDGMLCGPAFNLYIRLQNKYPEMKIIASGGVSSKNDLVDLKKAGLYGSVVGRAYYEKKVSLEEMKNVM